MGNRRDADYWGLLSSNGVRTRDATPLAVNPACPYQLTRSRILAYRGQDAAYDRMVQWMQKGTQPPSAPPLELSAITPSVVPVRNVFDNIVGGIRLPDFAVPTATDTGFNANTPALPGVRCFLYGQYIPFDTQTLRALYPTHGTYLLDTVTASNADVQRGYLLDEDAADANAAESSVGGSNLRNLDLSGVNLMGVSLPNESLVGDNLTNANLSNSNLQGANLNGDPLTGANLTGASLIGTNLQGANLQGANLTNANFGGATLKAASLGGVTWSNTVCPDGTNSDADGNTCMGHLGAL